MQLAIDRFVHAPLPRDGDPQVVLRDGPHPVHPDLLRDGERVPERPLRQRERPEQQVGEPRVRARGAGVAGVAELFERGGAAQDLVQEVAEIAG